jgi:creatinine amidohydrolase/Fe(II)-dependent formamide hydrolase-like protein
MEVCVDGKIHMGELSLPAFQERVEDGAVLFVPVGATAEKGRWLLAGAVDGIERAVREEFGI